MVKAVWNGATLAESNDTVVVEGNHYFPPDSIHREYFLESSHHSVCPWKGRASYYTIAVSGETNSDAAWFYPDAKPAAKEIRDRVAFWQGVKVVPSDAGTRTQENPSAVPGSSWLARLLHMGS